MSETADGSAQGDGEVKQDHKFFASSATITVTVGRDNRKRTYNLHEAVLVSQCPFFEKCLRSGMKEQVEQTVHLPEDNPEAFEIVVKWMHAEKVPTIINDLSIGHAYILANKLCMGELQNALVDKFRATYKKAMINPSTVTWIWAHTPEGCKLREISLDQLHFEILKSPFKYKNTEQFKKLMKSGGELVTEMYWKSVHQGAIATRKNPALLTGCVYHVHADGKNCT
ncbi:hypothetical protein LTS15_004705 [Exophiala xenobiotica]|nr:hypothetical protein LTS15_004705 [Exophiala xenobiotica]